MSMIKSLIYKIVIIDIFLIILFILTPYDIVNTVDQRVRTNSSLFNNTLYPDIAYSSFLGGDHWDCGNDIVIANDGNYFVVGGTGSSNFPILNNYNSTYTNNEDVFIAKFKFDRMLQWSIYLGGAGIDNGHGIAITNDGSCYVAGQTSSSNFPILNAYDDTLGGDFDAFVSKFAPNGSLLWSTFLGGSKGDFAEDIAVDIDGCCYVTGYTFSNDFPTLNGYDNTSNEFEGSEAFVSKFYADGSLVWSTYLGGNAGDMGLDIYVAQDDICYITGYTWSFNFPTLNAYDNSYNSGSDVFVSKFSASGALLWSSFLGGSDGEAGMGIAVASDGSCYVTGDTGSDDFPTLNAYDNTFNGWTDAFILKFAPNMTLLFSTYLGGNWTDIGEGVAVTNDGSCYVIGQTNSENFPTLNAYQNRTREWHDDIFISRFSTNGSIIWSTYLGGCSYDNGFGITVDFEGNSYVTGSTASLNFPVKNAFDSSLSGTDVFITKFIETKTSPIPISPTPLSCDHFYTPDIFYMLVPIIIGLVICFIVIPLIFFFVLQKKNE